MDEEAVKTMYDLAQQQGYQDSQADFEQLLATDAKALGTMYGLAQDKGYTDDLPTFEVLMGLKKKDEPVVMESVSDAGSSEQRLASRDLEAEARAEDIRARGTVGFQGAVYNPYTDVSITASKSYHSPAEIAKRDSATTAIDTREANIAASQLNQRQEEAQRITADLPPVTIPEGSVTDALQQLGDLYGPYGLQFSEEKVTDSMTRAGSKVVKATVPSGAGGKPVEVRLELDEDGNINPSEASKVDALLRENATYVGETDTSFVEKALEVQNLRSVPRIDSSGVSTVLMAWGDSDGKFIAHPTLFPKDPAGTMSTNPNDWIDLGVGVASMNEAEKRGEVFYFDTEKEAQAFAGGSWKDVVPMDLEFQKRHKEMGRDYDSDMAFLDELTERRDEYKFIEDLPVPGARYEEGLIPASYQKFFIDGNMVRDDIETMRDEKEAELSMLEAQFDEDNVLLRLKEDRDVALGERFEQLSTESAEINTDAKIRQNQLQAESLKNFGVRLEDLATYEPKTEEEFRGMIGLYNDYNQAASQRQAAALGYERAQTYYDKQYDKGITQEYVDGWEEVGVALGNGLKRGDAMSKLLLMQMGYYNVIGDEGAEEQAMREVSEIMDSQDPRRGRLVSRANMTGTTDSYLASIASNPGMYTAAITAESLGQLLPIWARVLPVAAAGGAIYGGATAGPVGGILGALSAVGYGTVAGITMVGMPISELALEMGNAVLEVGERMDYDWSDPNSSLKALNDEKLWADAAERGWERGIPIAAMGVLSNFFIGAAVGRAASLASTGERIARGVGTGLIAEPLTEALGERLAIGTTGEYTGSTANFREIMAEAIGAVGMGVGMGAAFGTIGYAGQKLKESNFDLAVKLMDPMSLGAENVSGQRIMNWANKMEKLGQITPEQAEYIRKNTGYRRQANELLGRDVDARPGTKAKVVGRLMELLEAKDHLSKPGTSFAFGRKLSEINEEISYIAENQSNSSEQVDLSLIDTRTRQAQPGAYKFNGKNVSRQDFLSKIQEATPRQLSRANVYNDNQVATELKARRDAISKRETTEVPVGKRTGFGSEVDGEVREITQEVINAQAEGKLDEDQIENLLSPIAAKKARGEKLTELEQQFAETNSDLLNQIEEDVKEFDELVGDTNVQTKEGISIIGKLTEEGEKVGRQARRAAKALRAAFPEVKIILHSDDASFVEAAKKEGLKGNGRAFYGFDSKEIHIHTGRAIDTTVAHEAFHAALRNSVDSSEVQALMGDFVTTLKKVIPADSDLAKKLDAFSQKYKADQVDEEYVAEFFGIITDAYPKLDTKAKSVIARFIERLAKLLNVDIKLPKDLTKRDKQILSILETLSGKVATGKAITATQKGQLESLARSTSREQRVTRIDEGKPKFNRDGLAVIKAAEHKVFQDATPKALEEYFAGGFSDVRDVHLALASRPDVRLWFSPIGGGFYFGYDTAKGPEILARFNIAWSGANAVELELLEVTDAKGSGIGSRFMTDFSAALDETNTTAQLMAYPPMWYERDMQGNEADAVAERLVDFYSKFGFTRDTEGDTSMTRQPGAKAVSPTREERLDADFRNTQLERIEGLRRRAKLSERLINTSFESMQDILSLEEQTAVREAVDPYDNGVTIEDLAYGELSETDVEAVNAFSDVPITSDSRVIENVDDLIEFSEEYADLRDDLETAQQLDSAPRAAEQQAVENLRAAEQNVDNFTKKEIEGMADNGVVGHFTTEVFDKFLPNFMKTGVYGAGFYFTGSMSTGKAFGKGPNARIAFVDINDMNLVDLNRVATPDEILTAANWLVDNDKLFYPYFMSEDTPPLDVAMMNLTSHMREGESVRIANMGKELTLRRLHLNLVFNYDEFEIEADRGVITPIFNEVYPEYQGIVNSESEQGTVKDMVIWDFDAINNNIVKPTRQFAESAAKGKVSVADFTEIVYEPTVTPEERMAELEEEMIRMKPEVEDALRAAEQEVDNFSEEQIQAMADEGVIFHFGNVDITKVIPKELKRFGLGYGFYFTNYALEDSVFRGLGERVTMADSKELNLLDGDTAITEEQAKALRNAAKTELQEAEEYGDDLGFEESQVLMSIAEAKAGEQWAAYFTYSLDDNRKAESELTDEQKATAARLVQEMLGFDGVTYGSDQDNAGVITSAWNFDKINRAIIQPGQEPTRAAEQLDIDTDGTGINLDGNEEVKAGQTSPTVSVSATKTVEASLEEDFRLEDVEGTITTGSSAAVGAARKIASGVVTYTKKNKVTGVVTTYPIKLPYQNKKLLLLLNRRVKARSAVKPKDVAKREALLNRIKETTGQILSDTVDVMTQNILAVYDSLTPEFVTASKEWYVGANRVANRISEIYGVTVEEAAGVLAALSPQNDWFNNIAVAERAFEVLKNHSDTPFSREIFDKALALNMGPKGPSKWGNQLAAEFAQYEGMTLNEMEAQGVPVTVQTNLLRAIDQAMYPGKVLMTTPDGDFIGFDSTPIRWSSPVEIAKAMNMYRNPSIENIREQLGGGNKVRNFYNNIVDPYSENPYVTADTHAASVALGVPMSANDAGGFGVFKGGRSVEYSLIKEAYIKAAEIAGIQPREMQSITWEAQRTGINNKSRTAAEIKSNVQLLTQLLEDETLTPYERTRRILAENRSDNPGWATSRGIEAQVSDLLEGIEAQAESRGREVLSLRRGAGRDVGDAAARVGEPAAEDRATEQRGPQGTEQQVDVDTEGPTIVYRSGAVASKAEPRGIMDGSRSTGHFGTGAYFFGDRESAEEYDDRDVTAVDISDYNLAPASRELHDALRGVNSTYYREFDEPRKEDGFELSDFTRVATALGRYEELIDSQDYPAPGHSPEDIRRYRDVLITERARNKKLVEDAKRIYNEPGAYDTRATIVMKLLGYDGVYATPGSDMDNYTYGTVIYDAKTEPRAAEQQVGDVVERYEFNPNGSLKNAELADELRRNLKRYGFSVKQFGTRMNDFHIVNPETGRRVDPKKIIKNSRADKLEEIQEREEFRADLEAAIAADEVSKPQVKVEEKTVAVVAPYFNTTIATVEDAATLRENDDYKAYKKTLVDTGKNMGIEVEVEETIGGFKNEAGEKIVEISNRIVLKNATLEQAEEYAALMGALTPEVQEATIAAQYVKEGAPSHNANEYTVRVEDSQAAIDALKVAGITDYTLNETTGAVTFIDVFDFRDETLQIKIGRFVLELETKGINHEREEYKPIASRYIGAGQRKEILSRVEKTRADLRQSGDVVRKAVNKAIKRDAKFQGKTTKEYKKPKPPEFRIEGESLGVSQDKTDAETMAVLEAMNKSAALTRAAQAEESAVLKARLEASENKTGPKLEEIQEREEFRAELEAQDLEERIIQIYDADERPFTGRDFESTAAEQQEGIEAMYRPDDTMRDIVAKGREMAFRDSAIRAVLMKRYGRDSTEAINTALAENADIFTVIPKAFGNVVGGLDVGRKIYGEVRAKLNEFMTPKSPGRMNKQQRADRIAELRKAYPKQSNLSDSQLLQKFPRKKVTPSRAEMMAEALEILKANRRFKEQPEKEQKELMVGFATSLKSRANKGVQNLLSQIRRDLIERKKGAKTAREVQAQLRTLINEVLPKSEYSKAQIAKLTKLVNEVKEDNYIVKAQKVLDLVEEKREQIRKATIREIVGFVTRSAKTYKTPGGRTRTRGLDAPGQAFFLKAKSILKAVMNKDDQSLIQDIGFNLATNPEVDIATAKLMNGEDLTVKEQALIDEKYAYDLFAPMADMTLEQVEAVLEDLKITAGFSRLNLSVIRMERARRLNALRQGAKDSVEGNWGGVVTKEVEEDGKTKIVPKDSNDLATDRANKKSFKDIMLEGGLQGKYRALVEWSKETKRLTPSKLIKNAQWWAHLGTITSVMGEFFNENIYNKINRMKEENLKGEYAQKEKLNDIANSIDGITNGYEEITQLIFMGSGTRVLTADEQGLTLSVKAGRRKFTTDELMRIYALSKNPIQRAKLERQGFTDKVMADVVEFLDPRLTEFVDKTVEYLSNEYYEGVNDVYIKVNDVNLGYMENYFPTRTQFQGDLATQSKDQLLSSTYSGPNSQMAAALKERVDTGSDILMNEGLGFHSELGNHINTMERFKAYSVGVQEINAILSDSFTVSLSELLGMGKVLNDGVSAAVMPDVFKSDLAFKSIDKWQSRFVMSALAFKPMQIVKQMTSSLAGVKEYQYGEEKNLPVDILMWSIDFARLLPKLILEGVSLGKYKGPVSTMIEDSDTLRRRIEENFGGDLYGLTSGVSGRTRRVTAKDYTLAAKALKGLARAGGTATSAGDVAGVMGYLPAYMRDIQNGMSKEEAIEKFNQYNKTQQSRREAERSPIQTRQDGVRRLFTAFTSSQLLYLNEIVTTANNMNQSVRRGESIKASDSRGFALALVGYSVMFMLATNMWQLMFGDDEEKEKAWKRVLISPISLLYVIPLIGPRINEMANWITGDDYPTSVVKDPYERVIREVIKSVKDEDYLKGVMEATEFRLGTNFDMFRGMMDISKGQPMDESFYDVMGVPPSQRPESD